MPISQTTLLLMYGDLCDLSDMGEKLAQMIAQGDLLKKPKQRQVDIERLALELALAVQRRQRQAISHMLGDEPDMSIDPLTGRVL